MAISSRTQNSAGWFFRLVSLYSLWWMLRIAKCPFAVKGSLLLVSCWVDIIIEMLVQLFKSSFLKAELCVQFHCLVILILYYSAWNDTLCHCICQSLHREPTWSPVPGHTAWIPISLVPAVLLQALLRAFSPECPGSVCVLWFGSFSGIAFRAASPDHLVLQPSECCVIHFSFTQSLLFIFLSLILFLVFLPKASEVYINRKLSVLFATIYDIAGIE